MDERILKIIIKMDNDTNAGFAALQAQLLALAGERGLAGVTREAEKASRSSVSFFDRLFGAIPGMRAFGYSLAGEVVAGIASAILILAPYVMALGAQIMNIISMGMLLAVGGGAIIGLLGAFVGLGGGVTRTGDLATANKQVAAAAETHENAVRKLQEGYVAWNSTATHTQLALMRLQDLQERVADTGKKLAEVQAHQADAQADVSPLAVKLKEDFSGMADALRDKMRPGADLILQWIDNLIPKIGALGTEMVDWFSKRIPASLDFLSGIVDKVLGKGGFGTAIGNVIDYVLAHKAEFVSFFSDVYNTAVNVFTWLMTAFINIHEWFKKSWPTILGFIKGFQDGVGVWGPLLKPILRDIGDTLGRIFDNISALQPLWALMGAGIGLMVTTSLSALGVLLHTLELIIEGFKAVESFTNKHKHQHFVGVAGRGGHYVDDYPGAGTGGANPNDGNRIGGI